MNKIILIFLLLFSITTFSQEKLNSKVTRMTLNECIKYALENSPDLQKLKLTHSKQEQETIIEKAEFAFYLSATNNNYLQDKSSTSSVAISKDLKNGFNITSSVNATDDHDEADDSSSFSIKISKIIIGGGSKLETTYGYESALIDELIALNRVKRKERELTYKVTQQFFQVVKEIKSLPIREAKLETAKTNLRFALDKDNKLDISIAKVEVPSNEIALLKANDSIKNGLDSLKKLIGMPVTDTFEIVPDYEFKVSKQDYKEDFLFAVDNHEDFINNRLEYKKLEWSQEIKKSHQVPIITLSAAHSQDSKGDTINFNGDEEQTIGVNLSWELGAASKKAELAKANFDLQIKDQDFTILKDEKMRKLINLSRKLTQTEKSITLQNKVIANEEYKVKYYKEIYEDGEIGIQEYVRSQNSYNESLVEKNTLETEYMEILSEYLFEIGK